MTIACLKGFGKMPFLRAKERRDNSLFTRIWENAIFEGQPVLSMKGEGCLYIVSQYVWDMDLESKFLKGLP